MDLGAVPYECGVKSLVHDGAERSDRNVFALLSPAGHNDVNALGMWIFNFCLPVTIIPWLTSVEDLDAQEAFGEIFSEQLKRDPGSHTKVSLQWCGDCQEWHTGSDPGSCLQARWAEPWVTEAAWNGREVTYWRN